MSARPYRWLLIGAACFGTAAQAYEIRIHKIVQIKHDVHESITALAEDCLQRSGGEQPGRCWPSARALAARSKSHWGEAYSDLQKASRWPDDPTRQDRNLSFVKIGYNAVRGCPRWVANNRKLEDVGLLCSSHYGRLQFLHAQAVDEDEGSAAKTHGRIMAWAKFAFRVARDERLEDGTRLLDAPYCSTIELEPEPIREMMRCEVGRYSKWTVSSFFSLTCRNPFSSARCGKPRPARARDVAQLAARGALLHLVQDSFSQSHTSRRVGNALPDDGGPDGFEPRVVCRYPTAYFNYRSQEENARGAHKRADPPPRRDDSCDDDPRTAAPADPETDDVVTASAMILWHLEKGTAQSLEDYLLARVFGPPPPA